MITGEEIWVCDKFSLLYISVFKEWLFQPKIKGSSHTLGIKYEPYNNVVFGGVRGVMVIIAENGHVDMSSNPGRDWLHFT